MPTNSDRNENSSWPLAIARTLASPITVVAKNSGWSKVSAKRANGGEANDEQQRAEQAADRARGDGDRQRALRPVALRERKAVPAARHRVGSPGMLSSSEEIEPPNTPPT